MSCMRMGLKILTFRSCELADISELGLDLAERDPNFILIIKKFLKNLTQVKDIIPLPQGICKDGEDVSCSFNLQMVVVLDLGVLGT